mmetsp:Transcript_23444/g.78839  ORF Transcript_23444/g.78839 Transcript_23444/m.78839 type:complete len:281 (-) Transcript_23444:395-1237(-)
MRCAKTDAPEPPMFWMRAAWAPSTWLAPARPVSWRAISAAWYTPVAPTGCPRALSPPNVAMGTSPFSSMPPCPAKAVPSPRGTKPAFSSERHAMMVYASCSSKMSTSLWLRPPWARASLADFSTARRCKGSGRSSTARMSEAAAEPHTRTAARPPGDASALSAVSTMAAAPSHIGDASKSLMGSVIVRAVSKVSRSIFFLSVECSAESALLCAVRAKGAKASWVTPYRLMYSFMSVPLSETKVAPLLPSFSQWEAVARPSVVRATSASVMSSAPATTTVS